MKVDWTSESDEEGTIFVRIHPKDQAEREEIIQTLTALLTEDEPQPASLYGETAKAIYGVTDDPGGRVMTRERNHYHEEPVLTLRVFRGDGK